MPDNQFVLVAVVASALVSVSAAWLCSSDLLSPLMTWCLSSSYILASVYDKQSIAILHY